jgi:hypothetical protein
LAERLVAEATAGEFNPLFPRGGPRRQARDVKRRADAAQPERAAGRERGVLERDTRPARGRAASDLEPALHREAAGAGQALGEPVAAQAAGEAVE